MLKGFVTARANAVRFAKRLSLESFSDRRDQKAITIADRVGVLFAAENELGHLPFPFLRLYGSSAACSKNVPEGIGNRDGSLAQFIGARYLFAGKDFLVWSSMARPHPPVTVGTPLSLKRFRHSDTFVTHKAPARAPTECPLCAPGPGVPWNDMSRILLSVVVHVVPGLFLG
jgi:hypothetical protein